MIATYASQTLPFGHAIEVFSTEPEHDGELIGYVILFSGGWDGWAVSRLSGEHMTLVARNAKSQQQAESVVACSWKGRR